MRLGQGYSQKQIMQLLVQIQILRRRFEGDNSVSGDICHVQFHSLASFEDSNTAITAYKVQQFPFLDLFLDISIVLRCLVSNCDSDDPTDITGCPSIQQPQP